MTEMLRLIQEHGIKAQDVRHVRVGTNANMPNALIHHRPKDELQAKFSMEFCMAILLLEGRAGLREFSDAVVLREDVRAMIEKVEFVVDQEAEAAGYHLMTTIIDITLNDGRRISGRADFGKGSPAFPMSYDEVAGKFRENAAFAGMSPTRSDDIVELVKNIEHQTSLETIAKLVASIG
jgi:2-methylcitrate dehydratase PrpD